MLDSKSKSSPSSTLLLALIGGFSFVLAISLVVLLRRRYTDENPRNRTFSSNKFPVLGYNVDGNGELEDTSRSLFYVKDKHTMNITRDAKAPRKFTNASDFSVESFPSTSSYIGVESMFTAKNTAQQISSNRAILHSYNESSELTHINLSKREEITNDIYAEYLRSKQDFEAIDVANKNKDGGLSTFSEQFTALNGFDFDIISSEINDFRSTNSFIMDERYTDFSMLSETSEMTMDIPEDEKETEI